MGVLDAFLSTWSGARQTFGAGDPAGGARFDNSATFRQLQGDVASAAPGSKWTGTASSAYDKANTEHGLVLGRLADLDQRLRTELDRSAQVISDGRGDLDALRQRVVDAASRVPQDTAGQRMLLLPIVSKGLKDLIDIVARSNTQLNSIGEAIRGIGGEYQALSNQRFAKGGL